MRTTLTDTARMARVVDEAAQTGINVLMVQVRGRADAYYASTLEPRAESLDRLTAGVDPLGFLIERAHARGLEVHAWVNAHLVWGIGPLPRDPSHLVNARPDLLTLPRPLAAELAARSPFSEGWVRRLHEWTVARDGAVEGLFTEPAHPEARARVAAVVGELLRRYPLDGIHLDYVRYGSPEFGFSRYGLDAFRTWVQSRVPPGQGAEFAARERSDPFVWVDALPDEFARFREEQITTLVLGVRDVVRAERPGAVLSAAVFADPVDALRGRAQDWPGWVRAGLVDAVAPMAYTRDLDRYERLLAAAGEVEGEPARVWMGIGVYMTPFETAVRQLELACTAGTGGVMLFSWDWMADEGGTPAAGKGWLEGISERAFRPGC